MKELKILPPEKARAKARTKVAEFQREKRRKELEEKLRPKTRAVSVGKTWMYVGQTLEVEKNGVKIKIGTARREDSQLYLVIEALGKRTGVACQEGTTFNDGKKLSVSIDKIHIEHEPNRLELTIKVPRDSAKAAAQLD
ncbi:MAG: hypothetical protein GY852_05310 [bacterium]|nr:hypothetical protein [bacterium]